MKSDARRSKDSISLHECCGTSVRYFTKPQNVESELEVFCMVPRHASVDDPRKDCTFTTTSSQKFNSWQLSGMAVSDSLQVICFRFRFRFPVRVRALVQGKRGTTSERGVLSKTRVIFHIWDRVSMRRTSKRTCSC